jgi:thiamine-monophosphate kinase
MDFNINPTVSALNGGEDYELLFTINQKDYEKIKNDPKLTVIGHITKKDQGINLLEMEIPLLHLKLKAGTISIAKLVKELSPSSKN